MPIGPWPLLAPPTGMKKTALLSIFVIALGALIAQAAPPFNGTIYDLSPPPVNIITDADHTTFLSAPYAGQGMRTVFDRRVDGEITMNAFLFDATFDDGLAAEVEVNPEFGDSATAGAVATKYATAIGRIPTASRKRVSKIVIHKGNNPFGGGSDNILIHTEQGDVYVTQYGNLDETFVHESSHTSLDPQHADAA